MYKVEGNKETVQIKDRLPRFSLFKWYETTLNFLVVVTYLLSTAFLIWRKGNRIPRMWYKIKEDLDKKTKPPKDMAAQARAVDIR